MRLAPDRFKVTAPILAVAAGGVVSGVMWRSDQPLSPIIDVPNRLELFALPGDDVTDAVRHFVAHRGLPEPPKAPRASAEQAALSLGAFLDGSLYDDAVKGWGHCQEPSWGRSPAADAAVAEMRDDGSWRYEGKYARGHFEDTALGICAPRVIQLLRYVRLTGSTRHLEAAKKALARLLVLQAFLEGRNPDLTQTRVGDLRVVHLPGLQDILLQGGNLSFTLLEGSCPQELVVVGTRLHPAEGSEAAVTVALEGSDCATVISLPRPGSYEFALSR